ncbi:MAG: hypothetical protein ACK56F_14715, partial [bacterium]
PRVIKTKIMLGLDGKPKMEASQGLSRAAKMDFLGLLFPFQTRCSGCSLAFGLKVRAQKFKRKFWCIRGQIV